MRMFKLRVPPLPSKRPVLDGRIRSDSYAGGRINFLRRKSSDLFGELFSERDSFIENGSNYSFYEEISLDLK